MAKKDQKMSAQAAVVNENMDGEDAGGTDGEHLVQSQNQRELPENQAQQAAYERGQHQKQDQTAAPFQAFAVDQRVDQAQQEKYGRRQLVDNDTGQRGAEGEEEAC